MTAIIPKEAGERLRQLRGVRTRTGVARELGISLSALQSYEDGARLPRDEVKCRIADYYGVTVQSIWYPQVDGDG